MAVGTDLIPATDALSPSVPTEPIWRLTVAQYHQMIASGILTDGDPVELLEGWLVTKMGKNPPHRVTTLLIRRALERMLPDGWYVDTQEPVTTDESEPEPDACVIRGDTRQYIDAHPGPGDAALVVEVAETSLARDRGMKKRIYARAGIPVYWIVNLVDRRIEVYSDPTGSGPTPDYRRADTYGPDEAVPVVVDGRELGHIPVRELLP